jgi:hypothetical protein
MVSNNSGGRLPNVALSIPVYNAYISIMNCYWRNERENSSVNLIKTDIAVKIKN